MYSLETIQAANAAAADTPPAVPHRDCSHHVTRAGVILHSATNRETLFVAREAPTFEAVAGYLAGAEQEHRNRFIEAFFLDEFPTVEDCIAAAR